MAIYYQDERYCCMNCGSTVFVETEGLKDKCSSCGSIRDNKRDKSNSNDWWFDQSANAGESEDNHV